MRRFAKEVFPLEEGPATQMSLIGSLDLTMLSPSSASMLLTLASETLINPMPLNSLMKRLISETVESLFISAHLEAEAKEVANFCSSWNGGISPPCSALGICTTKPG